MKVLVLNGSPKGEKSNTLNITKAFLDGFSADTEVEYITVKRKQSIHVWVAFRVGAEHPANVL